MQRRYIDLSLFIVLQNEQKEVFYMYFEHDLHVILLFCHGHTTCGFL